MITTSPALAVWNPADLPPHPRLDESAAWSPQDLVAWWQWAQLADASRLPLAEFDRVAFLGDAAGFFGLLGPRIVQALGKHGVLGGAVQVGALVGRVSDAKQERLEALWGPALRGRVHQWRVADALMAPPTARSLVIDCNDTLAGLSFRGPLQAAGWCVVDAVQMLEALSLPHTYVDVDVERSTILDQLSGYVEVSQWCSDALSRATLQARLQAMVALDRRGLVQVAQPFGLFTQAPDSRAALRVRPTDVYVDVGAAYGDTVSEFVQASGGQYGAIEAFEPDPVHVRALELLCSVLPRATAHACGVGEKAASLDFQEAPDNRFGSHFISAAPTMEPPVAACAALAAPVPPVKVPVVRLDDVIDHADLIKIDVEGFEAQVLRGGAALIARSRPSLHVSGYHGPSDLPELTRLLRALHPYQHCVIRHYGGSLYDTNLLVSDRQAFAVGR